MNYSKRNLVSKELRMAAGLTTGLSRGGLSWKPKAVLLRKGFAQFLWVHSRAEEV